LHFHVSAATGKQNGGRNNDQSASLPVTLTSIQDGNHQRT